MGSRALVAGALGVDKEHRRLLLASSLGTVFEWYDFFLYGALASTISKQFFSAVNETTGFILALLAFAAGFAVRPLGAIIFGRLGDIAGRKHTFVITISLMGLSTALVGVVPVYADIGVAAPIILVSLRILQGLALGGEYGGAAVYVAEHAPKDRRGRYTGWINSTASVGVLLSLVVVLSCRAAFGERFETWGWRDDRPLRVEAHPRPRSRDREAMCEITCRHRHPRQTLKDYYSNGMAEQGRYPQYGSKRFAVRVRLGHIRPVRMG